MTDHLPRAFDSTPGTFTTVLDDDSPGVTRNYSDALINAASKAGDVDEILEELEAVLTEALDRFPLFKVLLYSSTRNVGDKDQILVRTLEGRVSPMSLNFLRVLNRHGRLEHIGPILRAARESWNRRQNRIPVLVKAAVALEAGEINALKERLSALISGTPILHVEIDPSLIGGLIVQVGDDVYDVSVRNRLEQLRHKLIEGKTHEIQSRRDHFSHSE